eukprot:1089884-Pyramimonas_sp.AAC.1
MAPGRPIRAPQMPRRRSPTKYVELTRRLWLHVLKFDDRPLPECRKRPNIDLFEATATSSACHGKPPYFRKGWTQPPEEAEEEERRRKEW